MKEILAAIENDLFMKDASFIIYQNEEYQIVIDGEIYNEDELFAELKDIYPMHNTTEELVFYAWKHWGMQFSSHLEGAYTFLIGNKEQLLVVKDPLGLRPIYYCENNGNWYVSNSIKTLLNKSEKKAVLAKEGILELFSFGPGISEDKTLLKGIFTVPMGSYLEIKHHTANIYKYYELPVYEHKDNVEETAKHVKDLLLHSVNQQKQGCKSSFLSGGLDSSILTALCAQKDWNTYSLDYEGNKENFHSNMYQVSMDTDYINMMKDKYPLLHHHDLMITQKELASLLEEAMLAREMPGMADVDSSLLWLCKQVKQQEDVIISGECSDEIFGGYPWFYREELKDLDTFPWLRSTKERISLLNKKYQTLEFEEYIKKQYDNTLKDIQYLDSDTQEDKLARKHTLLCLHWFMQTLVVRQVCEGRWAGVNIRTPFANVRLLEYVYNIPWKMKFLNDEEKGILRKAFADILPKEVCERKKNPFPKTHNPIYAQIVSDIVKDTLKDKNSPLHKLFDDKKLDELIQSKGESFQLPWYGQLMSGPQLLAYLYQIHCWIKDFDIEIEESI